MKTPIRWAGSKQQMLGVLRRYWPGGRSKYVEPFAGSACFFFDAEPERALINDLNPDLIGAYRALRDDSASVFRHLRGMIPSEEAYYLIRKRDVSRLSRSEAAARFLFLNKYCFNGLYRTNQKGLFNVPYGHQRRKEHINYEQLARAAILLRRATLMNEDFEVALEEAAPGDFVFLDPPYATSATRLFSEYLPNSFGIADLNRLEKSLQRLNSRGVSFIITYADCEEALGLFEQWSPTRVTSRRNIAGFVGNRRTVDEVVGSNLGAIA